MVTSQGRTHHTKVTQLKRIFSATPSNDYNVIIHLCRCSNSRITNSEEIIVLGYGITRRFSFPLDSGLWRSRLPYQENHGSEVRGPPDQFSGEHLNESRRIEIFSLVQT